MKNIGSVWEWVRVDEEAEMEMEWKMEREIEIIVVVAWYPGGDEAMVEISTVRNA